MGHHRQIRYPNSIREYRLKVNLRLFEVAHLLGLADPSHIAHWEAGRKAPSLDNVLKLSAVLEAPVIVLYSERLQELRKDILNRKALPIKKPL
ncbi:MAG: helix-turn-helix transcriptional regulator [bacterium]|nr:helix-turn-helix transcriptional regulator [bacterium]